MDTVVYGNNIRWHLNSCFSISPKSTKNYWSPKYNDFTVF